MNDIVEPVRITLWKCPTCNTEYDHYEDGVACASTPTPLPKYQVNDIVYILERYPNNPKRPFVKRVITHVYPVKDGSSKGGRSRDYSPDHSVRYGLDQVVRVGKDLVIGYPQVNRGWDTDDRPAAPEEYLYSMGDETPIGCLGEHMVVVE